MQSAAMPRRGVERDYPAACYESTERQLQPLLKAPCPGVQQAASLEYDSGTCREAEDLSHISKA